MRHVVRAEYRYDAPDEVKTWHMVRERRNGEIGHVAMCGRRLREDAETRPGTEWGRTDEVFCHSCGALYLREVPSQPLGA
ncbi:hypothetical protein [Streptomyces radicis]|nr:hypothetical protein [Streptomyces radicis]